MIPTTDDVKFIDELVCKVVKDIGVVAKACEQHQRFAGSAPMRFLKLDTGLDCYESRKSLKLQHFGVVKMAYTRRIVCLANSSKYKKRCEAGKEVRADGVGGGILNCGSSAVWVLTQALGVGLGKIEPIPQPRNGTLNQ